MTLQEKIEHTNAIADAIQRGDAYYEIGNSRVVTLPSPQTTGTGMQQRTYAMSKAMDIITGNMVN